jgi:biofilm PGA synthesis N-glycosyltransferase PgaC
MIYLILEILSLFLICIAFYTFFLYPFVLKFLAKFFSKPINEDSAFTPEITVLIAAYNEEDYIEDAILSVENSNYPLDKIRILIGLDGSNDRTADIIRSLQKKYSNINFWEFPRSGKNFILNQLIEKIETDFVFFLDADLRIKTDSLQRLTAKFADKTVGGVMAAVNIIHESNENNDNAGRDGETFYQKVETVIRECESNIFGNTNSLGTLYGVRRSNLTYQPNDKVCDDMFVVLYTSLCRKRFIFDRTIIVNEVRKKSLSAEMMRRVRLVAGGLSTVQSVWKLLLPNYGWSSLFLWSHKTLRYLSPLIMIFLIISAIVLPESSLLKLPLVYSQLFFYCLVVLGWISDKIGIKIKLLRMAIFIFTMNIGFLLGIIRYITGGQNSKWEKIG